MWVFLFTSLDSISSRSYQGLLDSVRIGRATARIESNREAIPPDLNRSNALLTRSIRSISHSEALILPGILTYHL